MQNQQFNNRRSMFMQNKQDELEMQEQVADNSDEIINIIKGENGKSIVIINDIRFKGRQHIDWQAVEQYLKEYVGRYYEIIKKEKETEYPA